MNTMTDDAVPASLSDRERAAVYRELADEQEAVAATDVIRRRRNIATARRLFAIELRRKADAITSTTADHLTAEGQADEATESQPTQSVECGWSPIDATLACDWDRGCPVHGSTNDAREGRR